jgi:hypothetical protein
MRKKIFTRFTGILVPEEGCRERDSFHFPDL